MANTIAPRSNIYTGWFYDAVTPAMKLYNRGTLVETIATAGITFAGTLAPTSLGTASTGNVSTYQETAIGPALANLATIGLLTDSTTT